MKGIILIISLLSLGLCLQKHHSRLRLRHHKASSKRGDPIQAARFAMNGYKLHGVEGNVITSVRKSFH